MFKMPARGTYWPRFLGKIGQAGDNIFFQILFLYNVHSSLLLSPFGVTKRKRQKNLTAMCFYVVCRD